MLISALKPNLIKKVLNANKSFYLSMQIYLVLLSNWKIKDFPSPEIQLFLLCQLRFVKPPKVFPCWDFIKLKVGP